MRFGYNDSFYFTRLHSVDISFKFLPRRSSTTMHQLRVRLLDVLARKKQQALRAYLNRSFCSEQNADTCKGKMRSLQIQNCMVHLSKNIGAEERLPLEDDWTKILVYPDCVDTLVSVLLFCFPFRIAVAPKFCQIRREHSLTDQGPSTTASEEILDCAMMSLEGRAPRCGTVQARSARCPNPTMDDEPTPCSRDLEGWDGLGHFADLVCFFLSLYFVLSFSISATWQPEFFLCWRDIRPAVALNTASLVFWCDFASIFLLPAEEYRLVLNEPLSFLLVVFCKRTEMSPRVQPLDFVWPESML